jgi:Anti-sigma-28 factor, FlgM
MVDPVSFHPVGRLRAAIDKVPSNAAAHGSGANAEGLLAPSVPKLLSLVDDLTEQGPPIDFARVARIRQAIAERSYEIDEQAIARAIILFGHCSDS